MTFAPVEVSASAKLEVLRQLDHFREWHSLEETRYCLGCGKLIRGTEILVVSEGPEAGPFQLICPTTGCHSIPMDWVLPTAEILAILSNRKRQQSPQVGS